jgi:hypothetical protein
MNCLRSLAGIFSSNSTQGMDICVSVYSVFMLSCVYVVALRWADSPSKESHCLCKKDYETEDEAKAQQRTVEPLMSEWLYQYPVSHNASFIHKVVRHKYKQRSP